MNSVPRSSCSPAFVGLLWSSPATRGRAPTFTKDVAPILYKNCSQCHRPNEVAPMSLMTYEEVRPWARSIKSKVLKQEMPPWGIGESTLTVQQRSPDERDRRSGRWWHGSMPARRRATIADLPAPPSYPGGWKFNREPDVVVKMPVEFTIEPRSEYPMLDFYVPVPWTDGMKLIQMSEARPSNKAVVHHITVSLVTFPPGTEVIDGQPFTTDASGKKVPLDRRAARITEQKLPSELQIPREPGEKPDRLSSVGGFTTLLAYVAGRGFDDHPDGVGTPALPGQYLNFNMHYTPTGRVEKDRSEVGLWFAKEPLKKFHFRTPINERQHRQRQDWCAVRCPMRRTSKPAASRKARRRRTSRRSAGCRRFRRTCRITRSRRSSRSRRTSRSTVSIRTCTCAASRPSTRCVIPMGKEQLLFDVPKYRFDWQERYVLAEPLKIPKGSMLQYQRRVRQLGRTIRSIRIPTRKCTGPSRAGTR